MTNDPGREKKRERGVPRDVKLLRTASLLRSAGQGIALVEVGLYLRELGWGGGQTGMALAAAGIVRTVLTLLAAKLNARLGARKYLLLYEAIVVVGAALLAVSANAIAIGAAIAFAGLGAGRSGAGSPAAPIERAWLAAFARGDLHRAMNVYALIGFAGMSAGAALACLPVLWSGYWHGAAAYRPEFALVSLLAAGSVVCLLLVRSGQRKVRAVPASGQTADNAATEDLASPAALPATRHRPAARRAYLAAAGIAAIFVLSSLLRHVGLGRLALYLPIAAFLTPIAYRLLRHLFASRGTSARIGSDEKTRTLIGTLALMAASLTGSMTSYWFAHRFGAGSGAIGATAALAYAGAGLLSMANMNDGRTRITRTFRLAAPHLAALCLLLMPFASSFLPAAALEIVGTSCALGTRGSRTARMMEDRLPGSRTWSERIATAVVRFGAVLWPGSFGALLEAGEDVAPFAIGAALLSGSSALEEALHRGKEKLPAARPSPRKGTASS